MPLCFDLDGTLGTFGGGYALLRESLSELWGSPVEKAHLERCAGSTDWEIVDELHRLRFGRGLEDEDYEAFERSCLLKFQSAFHTQGRSPLPHAGLIQGLSHLLDRGHAIWLVSGNSPAVLAFKSQALGLDPRIPLLGSLPRHDRADLIRRALSGGSAPHLYVGDRPHDLQAAREAGVPFLAVGDAVPGDHPMLSPEAESRALIEAVERLFP